MIPTFSTSQLHHISRTFSLCTGFQDWMNAAASNSSHIVIGGWDCERCVIRHTTFKIRISRPTVIYLLSVRYNTSEDCVNCNNRHNINVCRIKPAQTCTISHIGRNLGVLLNNHVKYQLFLSQTILIDCQIHNSARLVWSTVYCG